MIQGHFLVRGNVDEPDAPNSTLLGRNSNHRTDNEHDEDDAINGSTDDDDHRYTPMLISDTSLSFWGGIDPMTGRVIDTLHPLYNTCVSNQILAIPSSRGSCTTSQVVLELILRGTGPRTILVRDTNEAVLCIGAIIAQEFFAHVPRSNRCSIVAIGTEGYQQLVRIAQTESSPLHGYVTSDGQLRIHNNEGTRMTLPTSSSSSTSMPVETTASHQDSVLSDEEQSYLDQSTSDAERRALKVIFQYARLSNLSTTSTPPPPPPQRQYIPIQQSHIDGCTYIGPGGLQFVQQLLHAGGRVKVPTTLNAVSTDRRHWSNYQVPVEYAQNAIALGDAYVELGCQPTFTCAPYLLLKPSSSSSSLADSPPTATTSPSIPVVTHSTATTAHHCTSSTGTTTDSRTHNANTNSIGTAPTSILFGQDIAWGESNAVVYANSVLGARTEKYADYLDICCAIAGMVPKIGVHRMEHRRPTVQIDGTTAFQIILQSLRMNHHHHHHQTDIDAHATSSSSSSTILDLDVLFPILGHLCGRLSDGRVPILTGFHSTDASDWNTIISTDHLKSFCAAFGTTASSPLIHIAGITPESKDPTTIQTFVSSCDTKRTIALQDLHATFHQFNASNNLDGTDDAIDLVALGNPHLSSSECTDLARIIEQVVGLPRTTTCAIDTTNSMNPESPIASLSSKGSTRIIACISRDIYAQSNPNDIRVMHDFGIEFIYDTCWCMILDEPIIPPNPLGTIITNSGKYAHYGPGLTNRRFRFGSMYDCIYAARYGHAPIRKLPSPESSFTTSPSSSSTLPRSKGATTAIDPYLSFLIRPSTKAKRILPNHSTIRSFSTTTNTTASLLSNRVRTTIVPTRRMPLATTALGNVVQALPGILKQCCR